MEDSIKIKSFQQSWILLCWKNLKVKIGRIFYYLRIWVLMSKNSFMVYLNQKAIFLIFLFGKVFRFLIFLAFIYFLLKGANSLAGYAPMQVVFVFLTFNLIDIISQFLFREVYRFRPLLVSGDFDLILQKPFSALFRILMGGADVIDLVTIPPLVFALVYVGRIINPSVIQIILYIFLVFNALLIATSFHIAVVSLGILTMEIDNTVMIYRDIINLGRFPIEIYKEPLRSVLTYLIPVGLMITLPAKVFTGFVNPISIFISFVIGGLLIFLSIKLWKYTLRYYTSASS